MHRTGRTTSGHAAGAGQANGQQPTANSASEADLVARARQEPQAFAALYDRYVEPMYRYAYRRTGSHSAAEDLVSATFHRALESLDGYEWRGVSFGAWLYRIASNLAVDGARKARPLSLDGLHADGFEVADGDGEAPGEALLAREEVDAAWGAVALLPSMQRRAVVLRFARGLSNAETGAAIGRSETATKQLVYRAIKSVRVTLERNGMLEGGGEPAPKTPGATEDNPDAPPRPRQRERGPGGEGKPPPSTRPVSSEQLEYGHRATGAKERGHE